MSPVPLQPKPGLPELCSCCDYPGCPHDFRAGDECSLCEQLSLRQSIKEKYGCADDCAACTSTDVWHVGEFEELTA